MKKDYLKIIFYKRLSKYTNNTSFINNTFDELIRFYTSDARQYHGLPHIVKLLSLHEEYKFYLQDEDVVFFAIWFHDAIYNTWRSNNEEKSAFWARETLRESTMLPENIDKVEQYIWATKTHESNNDSDLNFFLDFDLSILGSDDVIYDVYARQIREEYSLTPSFLYKRGRKKVLQSLLERPRLYQTVIFQKKFEAKARENIQRELKSL
jgi:predicted metal-dependent HD superfamily phosphohydrolase